MVMVLLTITILFARPTQANEIEDYLSKHDTVQEKVYTALKILRCNYPNWHDNYERGKFDCSEMSAYVKYCFQNWGIPAAYCQSDALWHCWIEVDTETDKFLIECTQLVIVPQNKWEDNYYKFRDVRYNRYMKPSEVDWWNSEYLQCRPPLPGG